ncbi:retinol dehydrogenase 8-like [Dendronephthya gigantea]|uniref:retinol dehydrogenase 8-like n=1 Tax=Dendronephthya gigantea TaxID=151771 RepID=UPI00106B7786|nr:retinol dehydrogenase 8-like [Dendronephthya gigantea]
MAQRVVIITGCSTGIGLDTAVLLAKNADKKFKVYACMRNLTKKDGLVTKAGDCVDKTLFILEMDVKSECSVNAAVKHVLDTDGRVDVLVNNAGIGAFGALEYQQMDKIKDVFETNVYGVIHAIRTVLPSMKKRKSGHIITVSSIGGLIGVPLNAVYCSTKFAVYGLSESLAPELAQFNIHVSLIEPGPVATAFGGTVQSKGIDGLENGDDETKGLIMKVIEAFQQSRIKAGQSGDDVAKCILEAIEDEKPHLHYLTNEAYEEVMKKKYVDITGDNMIQETTQRFFSSKKE